MIQEKSMNTGLSEAPPRISEWRPASGGRCGGWFNAIIMRFMDALMAFPMILRLP